MYDDPEERYLQRVESLDVAREVKAQRRALMRSLQAGRVDVIELLLNPPECIHTMPLIDLMFEMPARSRRRVSQAVQVTGVSPSKTVGGVPHWQRVALVTYIRDYW